MRARSARLLAPAAILVGLLVSCGLPSDGEPQVIAADRVPEELAVAPPDESEIEPGPADDTAVIYVFDEEGSNLQRVEVAAGDGGAAALQALLTFTPSETRQSFIPPTLTLEGFRILESGIVVLEMSTGLEEVEGSNQAKAVAQLVATVDEAVPGVDGLAIEVEGTAIQVPTDSLEEADVVWVEDYRAFTFLNDEN